MKNIYEIKYLKEGIPKKGIWYDHFGTIFISVMLKSKPHLRRKCLPNDNKKDNDLSEWHRTWQYDIIEQIYGYEKFGKKSYEVSINVDEETHRIDSLVENIAIEFQHTLSVSMEEMNSRKIAHLKYGLIPYLVIDLTDYSIEDFKEAYDSYQNSPLKRKIKKWKFSDYGKANNLFMDFNDGMVRIVNEIEKEFQIYNQEYFLDNLLTLEDKLLREIEIDREKVIKRENERIRLEKERKERETQLEKERIEKEKNWKKREELRLIEYEKETFELDKILDPEFKYYRFCFSNPTIKPYVTKYEEEIFKYYTYSEEEDGYFGKFHNYYSKDSDFSIEYITISKIVKKVVRNYYGKKTVRGFDYNCAKITLKIKNKIIVKFKLNRKNEIIKLTDKYTL